MVGPARVRGIMAPKSRSQRITRPPKRRSPKKRAPGVAAARRAASAPPRLPCPGMVEAALAAFAHEVRTPLTGILAISDLLATSDLDERERRWVDTIKAGAEHLASLATLFVDAAQKRQCRARCAAGFLRSAGAGAQRRRFAGRPGGGEGSAIVGRYFGETSGAGGRRSGPAARRAGKPDRQCGEVHRNRRRRAGGQADARRRKARSASPSRFPTAASGSRSTRSNACSARSRRPMSASRRASAAPGSDCRRSNSSRARWVATSS